MMIRSIRRRLPRTAKGTASAIMQQPFPWRTKHHKPTDRGEQKNRRETADAAARRRDVILIGAEGIEQLRAHAQHSNPKDVMRNPFHQRGNEKAQRKGDRFENDAQSAQKK